MIGLFKTHYKIKIHSMSSYELYLSYRPQKNKSQASIQILKKGEHPFEYLDVVIGIEFFLNSQK